MGTRLDLGLACVALVATLSCCGRTGQPTNQAAPDSTVINASAAIVETPAASAAAPDTLHGARSDACGLTKAGSLVGQPDSPSARAALLRIVGHHMVRWIKPGDVIARDVRVERLNVIVSDDGQIMAFRCG